MVSYFINQNTTFKKGDVKMFSVDAFLCNCFYYIAGEHFSEEYSKIHPFNKVPAIEHNGFALTERWPFYLSHKTSCARPLFSVNTFRQIDMITILSSTRSLPAYCIFLRMLMPCSFMSQYRKRMMKFNFLFLWKCQHFLAHRTSTACMLYSPWNNIYEIFSIETEQINWDKCVVGMSLCPL